MAIPPNRPSGRRSDTVASEMDFETTDPPRSGASPSFALQAIMELQRSQGVLENSINSLTKAVEKQTEKLDAFSAIATEIKILCVRVEQAADDIKETKTKLDKLRLWVAGAAGAVILVGAVIPIAVKLWPSEPKEPMPVVIKVEPPQTSPVPKPPQP